MSGAKSNTLELKEKVCLIAGASGAIGQAVARRFARAGASLALSCHAAKPNGFLDAISKGAARVRRFRMDVTDEREVRAFARHAHQTFGQIDVLVNCTGVLGPIGPLTTLQTRDWIRTVEVNLFGSFHLARAVVPFMQERGGGKIIFISGGGAAYGRPYFTAYSASKAALVRFTESLAEELLAANIQVNAIAPGPVMSRMWRQMRAAGAAGGPRLAAELKHMEETGGVAPDRAAALALFLASEESNSLTGRLISAIYDDWENLENRMGQIAGSDAWTLRRMPMPQ